GPHDMSTVSPSYDTLDVHPHRRLTEASLCHQPPYGRSLQQSKSRCVRSCAAYSYLLAFHILLLCAAGRNPTEIAAFLLCARSSVYRIVHAYRTGSLGIRIDQEGQRSIAVQSAICRCCRAVDRPHSTEFSGGTLRYSQHICHFNTFPPPCL